MKGLILAAGIGSRLYPLTSELPKAMVPVNGIPIIQKQIENLIENGINEIFVVVGFCAEKMENFVSKKFPNVIFIHNEEYRQTNNMYSAFLAKSHLDNCDLIMMNADVFFDSSILHSLIAFPKKDAIVTDIGRYNEESMKVTFSQGKITSISKKITENDSYGSSIDVYKFSKETSHGFFGICEEYIIQKKQRNFWSEVALNDLLKTTSFQPCPCIGRWFEIDTLEDLHEAELIFRDKAK